MAWLAVGTIEHLELRALSGASATVDDMRDLSFDHSLSSEVLRTGESISTEDLAQDERAVTMEHIPGWPVVGPAIVVPLRTGTETVGTLALGWTPSRVDQYHAIDPRLPANFAEQAALALQVVRSREAERRLALFEDRDRIGRDLHDLVIQRLFAVGLSLQSVSQMSESPEVNARIETAVEDLDATIKDIRRSIFALGATETAADIRTELTRMVDRAATTLKFRPTARAAGAGGVEGQPTRWPRTCWQCWARRCPTRPGTQEPPGSTYASAPRTSSSSWSRTTAADFPRTSGRAG